MDEKQLDNLKQAKILLDQLNTLRAKLNREKLVLTDEESLKQLRTLPLDIRAAQTELSNVEGSATNLYAQLRGVTSEIKGQTTSTTKLRGAFRNLEKIAQDLKFDEQEILDLNKQQIQALNEKVKDAAAIVEQETKNSILSKDIAKSIDEQVNKRIEEGKSLDEINDYVSDVLNKTEGLSKEEKAILSTFLDQQSTVKKLVHNADKREKLEGKISDNMGVTGALVKGTGALMERLGMRSGIFHDAMTDAGDEMRKMAKSTALNETTFSKLEIAAKGFSILAKGFGKALTDPAAIGGALLKSFLDLSKATVDITREVGRSNVSFNNLNTSLATTTDLLETAAHFTKETGLAATSIFSNQQLANIAESTKFLGLSAEAGNRLGLAAKLTGQSVSEFEEGLTDGISAANKFNKSVVAPGVALKDALNTSEDISLSLGNNPKLLGQAATAARALGLELSKVDNIAEGLLDFESSIQNELEAQLLTGKNINLAKARELALNNDLAGLSEELAKNGASAAEFANMNRIQQNALAQALGMSRQELAKSIMTQKAAADLTDEQRAKVLGVNAEQLKSLDIQTQINDSITKITENLAGLFGPIIKLLNSGVGQILTMGLIAANVGVALGKNLKMLYVSLGVEKAIGATKKKNLILQAKELILARKKTITDAIGAVFKNPLAAGIALAAAAGVGAVVGRLTKGDDVMSPGYGSRVLSTPEGSIALNNKDTVVAGTNLGGGGMNTRALEAKIDELIAAVKSGGDVFMDGNKVGEALTLGAYKSA